MYGADAVSLWFSLGAVVPKEFQEAIDNSRANVDFLVNMIYILVGFSVLADIRLCYVVVTKDLTAITFAQTYWVLIVACLVLPVAVRLTYCFSLTAIDTWGDFVKASFDLYLPALATQMGYEVPKSIEGRREFWIAVSQQTAFHVPLDPQRWASVDAMPEKGATAELAP